MTYWSTSRRSFADNTTKVIAARKDPLKYRRWLIASGDFLSI